MAKPAERKFSLFVHYNLRRPRDWDFNGSEVRLNETGRQRLARDVASLLPLLEPREGWEGFAFIFLDPGWRELVERDMTAVQAARFGASLLAMQRRLRVLVRDRPVRIVTAYNLLDLMEQLESGSNWQDLRNILIGPQGQLRYDSVKVIEAVIRIANFSRNVPLLRFDDDVIFPATKDRQERDAQIKASWKSILALCRHFDRLTLDPDVHYFAFSGSYLDPNDSQSLEKFSLGEPKKLSRQPLDLALSGFATRVVQLAKIPDTGKVQHLEAGSSTLANALGGIPWIDSANLQGNLDLETVGRFLDELWKIGANPYRQVISGAGFCLSDSAILDLPPYSNMRENVMWIDDHLKFALHHELRHFGVPTTQAAIHKSLSQDPRIGRIDDAWFHQERHPERESQEGERLKVSLGDVRWHCAEYLPRLLRGILADAWLRTDPKLKLRASSQKVPTWLQILKTGTKGPFARFFAETVRLSGQSLRSPSQAKRRKEIQGELWRSARERLEVAVGLWSDQEYEGTFLHLVTVGKTWLKGRKAQRSPYFYTFDRWKALGFLPQMLPEGLSKAVSQLPKGYPPNPPPKGTLAAFIVDLIEDFLAYVELVRLWKDIVQATRFLLNDRPDDFFWPFPTPYSKKSP